MVVGRFKDGTPVVDASAPSPGPRSSTTSTSRQDKDGPQMPGPRPYPQGQPARHHAAAPRSSGAQAADRRAAASPTASPCRAWCDPTRNATPIAAGRRGLLFMCFQANIEKQFEFIQRTWVDNHELSAGSSSREHRRRSADRPGPRRRPALAEGMGQRGGGQRKVQLRVRGHAEGRRVFLRAEPPVPEVALAAARAAPASPDALLAAARGRRSGGGEDERVRPR